MSPEVLVMSLRAWEALSGEEREIFLEAAVKSNIFMRQLWTSLEERSRQMALAADNVIISDLDRKPFEDAVAPIYDSVAADADARQLIDRIRQIK